MSDNIIKTDQCSERNPIVQKQLEIEFNSAEKEKETKLFMDNNIHIFYNIKLQINIQGLLAIIQIQQSIKNNKQLKQKKWTYRYQKFLDIQQKLKSYEDKLNNLNSEYYQNNMNDRIEVKDKFQELRDQLLILDNMKEEYIKSFKQPMNYQNNDNPIFQMFELDPKDLEILLNMKRDELFQHIKENPLFKQKQRNENVYVTIFEILMKEGYNIKSDIPLKQFKKLRALFDSQIEKYQDFYLLAFSQIYSSESQNLQISSLDLINQSIQCNDKYPKSLYLRGILQFEQKDRLAIETFDECIRLYPEFVAKEYRLAIETFDECIRIDPEFVDAFNASGNCHKQLKNYDQAMDRFQQALDIDPKSSKSYVGIASILKHQGQFEKKKAIEFYQKAIQLDPKNPDAYCGQGISLHYLKQYDEAIKLYDQAIQIDHQYIKAYINKGCSLDSQKQYLQALDQYQKAIDLNPKDVQLYIQVYIRKGISHHNLNQYDEALQMFEQALLKDSNHIPIYEHICNTLYSMQSYSKALQTNDRILEIDERNPNAHLRRGLLLWLLEGPSEEAKKAFEECLKIDKDNQLAQHYLNLINRNLKLC